MSKENTSEMQFPETLHEAIKYFAKEDVAFEFMKRVRWPDGNITCPRCGSGEHSFITTRKLWTCKNCKTKKQFTIKVGTVLEDSPIGYDKWICGFWLIANAKNGISSYEVGRALGVTQRTAWFMLQRIRMAMQGGSILKDKLKGIIEVDESWIGGSARNMHKGKKAKVMKGCQNTALTPVQGLLERGVRKGESKVMLKLIDGTKRPELQANVRKYVLKGSEVHTDAHNSYRGLCDEYTHETVDHAVSYVRGNVHTNGLENFWSLLKRTIRGTYVNVEPFHLFRYLAEQAFRFNERKDTDQGRFMKAIAGFIGKRLTWAKLTGDADGLPAT
jgi:transposase-like protein